MERLKQRIQIANKALKTLDEVLAIESLNSIERDALIQRFEYSFEAIWKTVKRFLNIVEGIDAISPKTVIRVSMETGLFDEEMTRQALVMADDRNLTSHTYNEELAQQITSRIPQHAVVLKHWLFAVENKLK